MRQSHFNKAKIHLLPDTQLSESSYKLLKFEVQLDLLLFYYDWEEQEVSISTTIDIYFHFCTAIVN